jgi:hypothetical protein
MSRGRTSPAAPDRPQPGQRIPHRSDQRLRRRCRRNTGANPHEQRVAQRLAQPRERVAHRRLGEMQLFGGARDAALRIDGLEHRQEIQVESTQVHAITIVNDWNS